MRYQTIGTAILSVALLTVTAADAQRTDTRSGSGRMNMGEYSGIKHALGVTEFENQGGWGAQWRLGNNLTLMLENALGETERFVLVDRQQLNNVIREQDLASSGRSAQARTVARTGAIRPAKYIASGAIVELEESASGQDGGIGIRGFRIGGGRQTAQLTIIVKLIDTTSSEVVAQERVIGRAGRTALRVGANFRGVGGDLGGFDKTPLGEAAQDCIDQAAAFIAKKMEEFPFEGNVIRVANNGQILINRGGEFGVSVGQEMVMRTEGEVIEDPMTGAILGMEEGAEIGRLRVVRVEEKFSYCDVVSGEPNPGIGSVVYLR